MRLVGRDSELDRLTGLLSAVNVQSSVTTIVGVPGIGKSSLLIALAQRASESGALVLRCQPSELERDLPAAALGDLLAGIEDLSTLDPLPRAALEQVLLRAPSGAEPLDIRLVGVGLAAAIGSLASSAHPVVVIADDLHWFDSVSAQALAFAARRLPETGVLLVAARRPHEPATTLPGDEHVLASLHDDALLTVLTERTAQTRPRPGARLLREALAAAGGNPLYAIELARALAEAPTQGGRLVIPATLEAAIEGRLGGVSVDVRLALTTIALLARPDLAVVRRLGLGDEIATAEADGLVDTGSGRVVFAHPLFPAVLRQQLPAMRRRALHARLADVVENEEESARHAALAAEGPDAQLAVRLAEAAASVEHRAAIDLAAELAAHAARLTPPGDADGAARCVFAGRLVFATGDTDGALDLLGSADEHPRQPADKVRELCVRTAIAYATGNVRPANLAVAALPWCRTDAERIEVEALIARVMYDNFTVAAEHAQRAMDLARTTEIPPTVRVSVLLAATGPAFIAGRGLDRALFEEAIAIQREITMITAESAFGCYAALLKMVDDIDESRAMFLRLIAETDDEGSLPFALSHLPQIELWSGNWDLAEDYAQRHLEAALRTGQHDQVSQARSNLATIGAHRGELDDSIALATQIAVHAREIDDAWAERSAYGLLGFVALSNGDARVAAEHCDRWHQLGEAMGIGDPGYCRMEGDHVEALVACGRIGDAARRWAQIDATARRLDRSRAIGGADRVGALIAAASDDPVTALARGRSAVERLAAGPFVFEHARAQLTLGQIHRRFKEKAAARELLQAALSTFERLGAERFAERARQDLERIGSRPPTAFALTATEQRVADLAATGATVRQIGTELFISPKTVEANLTRVYRKLGISGRAQLARWIADRDHRV